MSKTYTFNQTVRGYSHLGKNIVCQDYSGVFQNEDYEIAVVSDGHGDPSCFRSDIGSKFAVEISIATLKNFANDIMEKSSLYEGLKVADERVITIKKLTDIIIKKWIGAIKEDFQANRPTEDDFSKCNSYADIYRSGKKLPHIYGATLIIALRIKDLFILIQQGDGGCAVFLEDGSVVHPIPEDVNCHANVTTSLCDANARDGIRHCVLDLNEHSVIACFLGSDGVEDSYSDDDGNTIFYKELMIDYFDEYKKNHDKFISSLIDYLPKFSEKGSGDDISVAGIVSISKMEKAVENYTNEVEYYNNLQEFNYYTQKINSMKRKRDFLEEKLTTLRNECDEIQKELEHNKENIKLLSTNISSTISVSEQTDKAFNQIIEHRNKTKHDLLIVKKSISNNKVNIIRTERYITDINNKLSEAN